MSEYKPEGSLINTAANFSALSSLTLLREAIDNSALLEGRVSSCDAQHNLHIDMRIMEGIIPRNEGAAGIDSGGVKDIALISRVGKSVCFIPTAIKHKASGEPYALLSRRKAQLKAQEDYIDKLSAGDVTEVKITHNEAYGSFCDLACGISALLPIEAMSVSRIPHPSARFFVGENIKCIVKSRDAKGRILLSHKELLGTWEENAALFSVGETVTGIVRSVEPYGIFIELAPNLAGLAEYAENISEGMTAAVYIKNIIPEKHKIKLVIVDAFNEKQAIKPVKYFFTGSRFPL